MKTLKLIYKGILLYTTTIIIALVLCGIDSIVEQGQFIYWASITVLLVYVCYKIISRKELDILTLNRYFNKM